MYTKAQELGLPALFVDLRHEATHGDMPSLSNLRSAAKRALEWLWEDYWKGLGRDDASDGVGIDEEADSIGTGEVSQKRDAEMQVESWARQEGYWVPIPIGVVSTT